MRSTIRIFILFIVIIVSLIAMDHPVVEEGLPIPVNLPEIDSISQKENEIEEEVYDCVKDDERTDSHDEWELLWNDEYNGDCIDTDKWTIEDWAAIKNNELQYYSPNNVKVEDGVLKLISREERYKGRDYTSGAVHTKDKFELLYGKVEIRAKLPAGQGLFPAFWMMTNQEDSWLPEIDIMEMLGHKPNKIWMVVHWLNEDGKLTNDSRSFMHVGYNPIWKTIAANYYRQKAESQHKCCNRNCSNRRRNDSSYVAIVFQQV